MKVLAVLALCLVAVNAVVPHTRCGGVGTSHEVRIGGCDGSPCNVTPGTPANLELDATFSSAAQHVALKVTAVYLGLTIDIIDTTINQPVPQGNRVTIRFSITPNDLLRGQTLPITANLRNHNALLETCVTVSIRIA